MNKSEIYFIKTKIFNKAYLNYNYYSCLKHGPYAVLKNLTPPEHKCPYCNSVGTQINPNYFIQIIQNILTS